MSVEAKLILNGVEPFSIVVCGMFVVEPVEVIVVVVVAVTVFVAVVVVVVELVLIVVEVVVVEVVVETVEVVGCKYVMEPFWMIGTEVVGLSVEAKLILKGVEPFSIDVGGRFVVELV